MRAALDTAPRYLPLRDLELLLDTELTLREVAAIGIENVDRLTGAAAIVRRCERAQQGGR